MRFTSPSLLPLLALLLSACGGAEQIETGTEGTAGAVPSVIAPPVVTAPATLEVSGATAASDVAMVNGDPAAAARINGQADMQTPRRESNVPAAGAPQRSAVETSAPAPPPVPATAPDAERILARAETAYNGLGSMQADFVQHLTVPLLGSTQRSRGTLYSRRPDRFLMKFSDPAGDVIVADGRHFWMYYPSTDATQVMRAPIGEDGQQADLQREFLSRPTERYAATSSGSESVGGRPAHVVTLVPKVRSPYTRIRIWVDKDDALVRRFEMTERNETVRRVELSDLKRNPRLGDALFRFAPPPNAQIFDQ